MSSLNMASLRVESRRITSIRPLGGGKVSGSHVSWPSVSVLTDSNWKVVKTAVEKKINSASTKRKNFE